MHDHAQAGGWVDGLCVVMLYHYIYNIYHYIYNIYHYIYEYCIIIHIFSSTRAGGTWIIFYIYSDQVLGLDRRYLDVCVIIIF